MTPKKPAESVTPEQAVDVPGDEAGDSPGTSRGQSLAAEPPVRDSGPVEGVRGNREVPPAAEPPVRDSGPVEGVRGNREVPPASDDQLAEVEAQRDEYLRDLQRLAADFDNYRKRVAREQESLVARAHERLIKELLPVLDDLERALVAAEEHDEAKLVDGVKLVRQALHQALEREGLVEIEADGAFDPHVHEALLAQPAEGREHGEVLEVLQKGYRLGDKVLRPSRVIVAE